MISEQLVGIGIGASSVKVVVAGDDPRSPRVMLRDHLGDPRTVVAEMLAEIDLRNVRGIGVTGGEGAAMFQGKKIYEGEAIEESLRLLELDADVILSLGGESFVAYPLDKHGRVLDYVAGNKCAAGTVEFFKQQLGRMNLTIEEGAELAAEGSVVPLAKRCSVHCKSDCTHALNKNRCSVADIVHTLCHNMAEKAVGLLRGRGITKGHLLMIGGASANEVVVDYVRKLLPDCTVTVPEQAAYFEALGAASLARERSLEIPKRWEDMFTAAESSFGQLLPLGNFADQVTFLPSRIAKVRAGRKYILGIDGGSTTTKAALVDIESLEICASRYLRTNGNPEQAMKECLVAIKEEVSAELGDDDVDIVGIATTGSSGEILSVLCETPGYHNEIIAHAYGASYFCPDVDTIFEIGGQDSKFTLLRSRVAVDFNMNESCSAGTGSFIEESAKDDLGVQMHEIADLALASDAPPRFADQCAAFTNTDIRKASQEGASREDNLAGLVYAIVENFMTKVVGERRVGDHILFQGGTSKNKAIAYAFAAKTGKHITVPPDSELMGCFGIALWLREKIRSGDIPEQTCHLDDILANAVTEKSEFTCKSCENYCTIQNLVIGGKKHPFGGQCSKWENARNSTKIDTAEFDLVARRNQMVFNEFGVPALADAVESDRPVIGIQGVFSGYALYPLYSWFFSELGYDIRLSETMDHHGVQMCQSTRCYPYEIAHGTFQDLISKGVKKIFVPHLVGMPIHKGASGSITCPMAQAAPYYLSAAFEHADVEICDPILDMTNGMDVAESEFVKLGVSLGHDAEDARKAFRKGCEQQDAYGEAAKAEGRKALEKVENSNSVAIVLVGRPYNAFSKLANMGIPRKFASRGITIIPYEFLPFEEESTEHTMYWTYGQMILKTLKFVKRHSMLFPVYISNFGCGPDSFLQHFASFLMDRKPMLYLELDSHTADAGIGTRAAAFLDIVSGYRQQGDGEVTDNAFKAAEYFDDPAGAYVIASNGDKVPMVDPRVVMAFPPMGRFHTEGAAAAASGRGLNFRTTALPPVDDRVLALGKSFTSGKECSPAVFTVGALVNYFREIHKKERSDEILVYFMPTANGPCRFGQYNVYMKKLIQMLEMPDVAILSPSAANSYGSLGWRFLRSAWQCFIISDLLRDIRILLSIAAEDKAEAQRIFEDQWQRLLKAFALGYDATWNALEKTSEVLSRIPLSLDVDKVPKVLLTGEIYVRSDELSRRNIEDYYAEEGLMVKIADSVEWMYYTDWHYLNRLSNGDAFPGKFLRKRVFFKRLAKAVFSADKDSRSFVGARLNLAYKCRVEKKAREMLSMSGLVTTESHKIDRVVEEGSPFVNPALAGEAVLTAGATKLVFENSPKENYCGVIFIGPFNCMPTGVSESVIKPYARKREIPFLTFETDGGPMTPNFRSQMEVHMLRSKIYARERTTATVE